MNHDPLLANDPVGFILAADVNTETKPSPVDAVWQISLSPQTPLHIETNLGLNVRSLKVFPVFKFNHQTINQISSYFTKPIIQENLPNYFSLVFHPLKNLLVRYELWAKTTTDLMGRVTLTNESAELVEFETQMLAELLPLNEACGFAHAKAENKTYLKGAFDSFRLEFWVDKYVNSILSPMPGLAFYKAFVPGETAYLYWQCAILEPTQTALKQMRQPFPENWEALIALQRSTVQSHLLEFETGNPDFDLTLRASQLLATQLKTGDDQFDSVRNPSLTLEGKRGGRTQVAEVWQMVLSTLPINPSYAAAILKDSILSNHQAASDKIKRGLAAPFPVLARLAWKVYQRSQNRSFLGEVFDHLVDLDLSWFSPFNDADQDGLPEWRSIVDTGFSSSFGFSLIYADQLPGDIRQTENFTLGLLLKKELSSLIQIANCIENTQAASLIQERLIKLNNALEHWRKENPENAWRDVITHNSDESLVLFQAPHQSAHLLNLQLDTPLRVHLQIRPSEQTHKPTSIMIQGKMEGGETAECLIQSPQIQWLPGYFYAVSDRAFEVIESIHVEGLEFAELTVFTPQLPTNDFTSLFLDFFNSVDEQPHLVEDWQKLTLFTAYGLPERLSDTNEPESKQVNSFWLSLFIEELIESGQETLAGILLQSTLKAKTMILKNEHALFSTHQSANAKPAGTRNSVDSLVPIEQLLAVAGITLYHATKVSIGGKIGFSQPITIRYRGLEVKRDGKNASIRMPDGTEFHHFGSLTKTYRI